MRLYLGQGIKYPHAVDTFGRIALTNDKELVQQSLFIIFSTPLGSEFFREHEGSEHRILMFEPNDSILKSLLDFYCVDAIARMEKRIKIIDLKYSQPQDRPHLITVTIIYRIRQSNEEDSYIFPFYRTLKD